MIEIIIGFDFFTGACFDGNIPSGNIYRMELMNSKVDEIKIDTGTNTQTYNNQKQPWGLNTILKCPFTDLNFEAGNVTLAGMPIQYIRIKKRREGDLTWGSFKDIPFNPNQIDYKWSDFFCQSLETYQYAILPVGVQGIEGTYGTQSVDCSYEDIWILGADSQQFHLIANISMGDIQTVSPSSLIETLGSQYPYEIQNGNISYRKSNVSAVLISDSTLSENVGIDRKAEKTLRESLYKFLTNKKPKVFKESEGTYMLASIKADSVKITPNNDLSRRICNVAFDLIEIGDTQSIKALQESGLLV